MLNTTLVPYSQFKYWFIRNPDSSLAVYDKITNEYLCKILEGDIFSDVSLDIHSSEILQDLIKFKSRPEFVVGLDLTADLKSKSAAELSETYDMLLAGCALIRARRTTNNDPDKALSQINKTLNWLHSTDFYTAPASTMYHDSFEGGLIRHTLTVANIISKFCNCPPFESLVYLDQAVLVALVHDWCKIGNYESYLKNVKNEKTDKWEQKPAYRRVGEPNPIGHGALSMYYATRCFNLSVGEAAAIRWHMGRFRCCEDEINELQAANESYPLVHLLQFADQLSIVKYL